MINIAMKSKGTLDQNSLMSINQNRSQGVFTSQNITTLNKAFMQNSPHTPSGTFVPSHIPPAGTGPRSSRQTGPAAQSPARQPARPAAPPSAPLQKKLPPLAKPLRKGQKASLSASGVSPGILKACFGWNTSNPQCDADVSAFLLGDNGKVTGDSWFVFYGQKESPDKSCRFTDGLSTDRESITIDFHKLNPKVKKIVFVLTINEAFAKRLHFGMMKDAYMRILDSSSTELASFQMQEYYSNVISMVIGEIYQYNGGWKFNAVGNGVARDLAGLCAMYGVEVSE